ncbi:MAG: hypothetical protein QOD33_796 [Pyrinomonadaceae bacterium]|jgi:hypothetical protein|nr:hypothetical protein [Pyrinomonadaceae bacterium]
MNEHDEETIGNDAGASEVEADKGPTEKLRDEEKSETGKLVPGVAGVPGAQKQDNEDIKEEKGLNTE